ncbi:MAG: ABC transporter permease [Blastocatellia bacterium]
MENLLKDLRYGARALFKNPGFTVVAVLALALGIGANTAVFSIVNAVLLRPLRFENPERLVTIWETNLSQGLGHSQVSPVTFTDWRQQKQIFDDVTTWWYPQVNLTDTGTEPVRVRTIDATDNFFSVLGVQPMLGRLFMPGEDQRGADSIAVLSYNLWKSRFNADPDVIGKPVTLDGRVHTVVGVMPQGFNYPENIEVWRPLGWDPAQHNRGARFMEAVARLAPGVQIEQAQADMSALSRRFEQEYPRTSVDWGVTLIPLRNEIVGNFRVALLVMLGAVAFVLLIACANIANLLLARAGARQKEIAIRLALGASRSRLIRQFLTESILLASLGCALGLVLAYFGGKALMTLNPVAIPRLNEIGIDARMLGFTLGITLVTGIIFGLVPALQASKPDLNQVLKEGGRDSKTSSGNRIRNALVVSEIAIALVLLIGAGLMLKTFIRLQGAEPGFNPQNILTFNLQLPISKYSDWRQVSSFYTRILDRIKTIPGVQSADAASFLPLESGWRLKFSIADRPPAELGEEPIAQHRPISKGYFQTMGIPLIAGRELTERDHADAPGVIVINQALANRYWPDEDPIGKRVGSTTRSIGPLGRNMPRVLEFEVVGVVGNEKNNGLNAAAEPAIYFSHDQFAYRSMSVMVRSTQNPMSLLGAIQNEVWAMDNSLPVSEVKTANQILANSVAQPRFSVLLLGIFAALALVLAAVGIYGVMAYSITQRTREIGIRMALGAQSGDVMKMVLREGFKFAVTGIGIGLAGAFLLTRVLTSLLYGVSAADPLIYGAVSIILASVALIACYIPARRATKVDPLIALRYE